MTSLKKLTVCVLAVWLGEGSPDSTTAHIWRQSPGEHQRQNGFYSSLIGERYRAGAGWEWYRNRNPTYMPGSYPWPELLEARHECPLQRPISNGTLKSPYLHGSRSCNTRPMLRSRRLATLPLDIPTLAEELSVLDAAPAPAEYDSFTFGTWVAHVLANGSGAQDDTAFRPHGDALVTTDLGARLPGIMDFVHRHFNTNALQWVRVFGLQDGILAPHRDFLEFESPGVRVQVPLRTSEESLHSENSTVYHLRAGEVWQIQTIDTHSASSGPGPARLSLCLDFSAEGFDPERDILGAIPAVADIRTIERPPISEAEIGELIETLGPMTQDTAKLVFRTLAATHFRRESDATDVFTWFERAARHGDHKDLIALAQAFRVFCIEKRSWREDFAW